MIPNIVHFNYGLIEQKEDFLFVYYIAVLSCKLINNPDKIFFYYHYEPKGIWWEKTKLLVDLIKVDIPEYIGEKKIKKVAHKSDILRIEIIKKYGGIYLDIDTICVRSYRDLLYNKCVIANEITDSGKNMGLCNAIFMAEPESSFITEWYNLYEEHFNPDGWQEASTMLPQFVAQRNTDVTILPRNTFLYPSWDRISLIFVDDNIIYPDLIVLHYWNQHSLSILKKINGFDWVIENKNTLYGQLLVNVFSKLSQLPELKNFTKDFFINEMNNSYFVLNNIEDRKINILEHYTNENNINLVNNVIFKNDFILTENVVYPVFSIDINEIPVIEDTNIEKINDYYKIKLLSNKKKITIDDYTIYNLENIDLFYIFPTNYQITLPIDNLVIKYNIAINDIKFIITTQYLNSTEGLIIIRRSDTDYGWYENLYLDITVNNKNYYYYVGKSNTNKMKVVFTVDTELTPVNLEYSQLIPKKIYQTWKDRNLDLELQNTVDSIIENNPEYSHYLFDNEDIQNFIEEHFDEEVLFAYKNLIPGAFKADLFRYCVLYIEGGVYMDCKMISNVPFRQFIKEDDTLILVDDLFQQQRGYGNSGIYNAFMATVKGSILLKNAIDTIVKNVKELYFPDDPFYITGPMLLSDVFKKTGIDDVRMLIHPYIGYEHDNHNNGIFDENKNLVIYKNNKNYYKKFGGGNYIKQYADGICYKNVISLFTKKDLTGNVEIKEFEFTFNPPCINFFKEQLKNYEVVGIKEGEFTKLINLDGTQLPNKLKILLKEKE
jgi:mannosyltransferase OCH1-like enzyme